MSLEKFLLQPFGAKPQEIVTQTIHEVGAYRYPISVRLNQEQLNNLYSWMEKEGYNEKERSTFIRDYLFEGLRNGNKSKQKTKK